MSGWEALIGRTLGGRFLLKALLAEGAMGAVFRGSVAGGSLDVAVKVLSPGLAENPAMRARFDHEARMGARIDHPNVARVLGHGTEHGLSYLVMELVLGRELFEVVTEAGRLSPARAASIVLQICDALATAHERGIIHRDLKPENVMLSGHPWSPGGERATILDFGVAKQMELTGAEDELAEDITVVGTILGTPDYMSPEQCRGSAIDARADIYACGALLYHLVTGRPPFEDRNPWNTLVRQINEAPRPPSAAVPGLDPALEATILKALAKRPEDRHQSAIELWDELLAELPRLVGTSPALAPAAAKVAVRSLACRWVGYHPQGALS